MESGAVARPCMSRCEFFRCGRRALLFREGRPWCGFVNEACDPSVCAYVTCMRGKLLANNKCGLTIKRVTVENTTPNDFKVDIKLRHRDLRKFGDDDLA